MKVTGSSSSNITLFVLLTCNLLSLYVIDAKPMFGTAGMMRRRFPGASEMSYNTYQGMSQGNRQGERAPVYVQPRAVSSAGSQSSSGWMFNGAGLDNTINNDNNLFDLRSQFNQNQGLYHQQTKYPSLFTPRESFAYLYFPEDVQYQRRHGSSNGGYAPYF